MQKFIILPILFVSFLCSCNFLTFTGAETSLDPNSFTLKSGGFSGPIVTDISSNFSAGGDCNDATAYKIFGTNITSNTRVFIVNSASDVDQQEVNIGSSTNTVINITLNGALPSSNSYYIRVEDNGAQSTGAWFFAGCV